MYVFKMFQHQVILTDILQYLIPVNINATFPPTTVVSLPPARARPAPGTVRPYAQLPNVLLMKKDIYIYICMFFIYKYKSYMCHFGVR